MPGMKIKGKGAKGAFNSLSGGGQSGEYTITSLGMLMKNLIGDESRDLSGDDHAPRSPMAGTGSGSPWG